MNLFQSLNETVIYGFKYTVNTELNISTCAILVPEV